MKAGAAMWNISLYEIKRAKNGGSAAFSTNRVYREPLVAWLEANPRGEHDPSAAACAEAHELKKQKLQAEILVLQKRVEKESHALGTLLGDSVGKDVIREEWGTKLAIIQEEARALLSRDDFSTFIQRVKKRITSRPLSEQAGK